MDIIKFLSTLFSNGGAQPQSQAPIQGSSQSLQPTQNPQQGGQIPVGQALNPQDISRLSPELQPLATIYAQNPQDPRVAHIDPKVFGYAPDDPKSIGYNPNPSTDIPYTAHTKQLAELGNQYSQSPLQFFGADAVDPGLFGYPADGPGGVNPNNAFRSGQQVPANYRGTSPLASGPSGLGSNGPSVAGNGLIPIGRANQHNTVQAPAPSALRGLIPYQSPVDGASDPLQNLQRGGTIYTPGEGPRTNYRY